MRHAISIVAALLLGGLSLLAPPSGPQAGGTRLRDISDDGTGLPLSVDPEPSLNATASPSRRTLPASPKSPRRTSAPTSFTPLRNWRRSTERGP